MRTPLLSVTGLSKTFGTGALALRAVNAVTLGLARGETLGMVGESGSGKSTLGKMLVRLIEPDQGVMTLQDTDYTRLQGRGLQRFRRGIQMIFQDPQSSLNPRNSIGRTLEEPYIVQGRGTRAERKEWAAAMLQRVGLDPSFVSRRPHELSGGQRQRVAIARALALDPQVIVCDEVVSALDVSVQGQVINLLKDVQEATGVSYVFIAHNLAILTYVAHRVAVMYRGSVVEIGPTAELWTEPLHPYTASLVAAFPAIRPGSTLHFPAQMKASSAASEPHTVHLAADRPEVLLPPASALREVRSGRFVLCPAS